MRYIYDMNAEWLFTQNGETEVIDLPHTWNAFDGQDGGGDYDRGVYTYEKTIDVPLDKDEIAFLEFEGVSQIADVYINEEHVLRNASGFATFRCPLVDGENIIRVEVDNRPNEETYPQMADFTFFGGIYRDVNLIVVNKNHFALKDHGTPGFRVKPYKEGEDWFLEVQNYLECDGETKPEDLRVTVELIDPEAPDNEPVLYSEMDPDTTITLPVTPAHEPRLWHGIEDPYLYLVRLSLRTSNETLDEVEAPIGFRTYEIDPEKGFILNGEPYPLRGVSRHQCRLDKGWALDFEDHLEDILLIREIGATTVRLAHYQHDQKFYDLCDQAGLVVWAEIPFISKFMNNEKAKENTLTQMTNLIYQNYHHPSIVVWGIANEITIGGDSPELYENLKELNDLAHKLDDSRKTVLANVTMEEDDSPHNYITDVVSFNHYYGWYMGDAEENAKVFDSFHRTNPTVPYGISEYGAEGIIHWHSTEPKVKDYTEEYQAIYHETLARIINERPYLWATHVWAMFDFCCDQRNEGGVQGRNNKGLVTIDRKVKKDAFYIYKAYWNPEPMIHICSRRFYHRPLETEIKAYGNTDQAELFVNGESLGAKTFDHHIARWNVTLKEGQNTIRLVAEDLEETIFLDGVKEPYEGYVLPDDGGSRVINWFEDESGEVVEFQYPEGHYSIRDKIGDLLDHPETAPIIQAFLKGPAAAGGGLAASATQNPKMMKVMRGFTVESLVGMLGDKVSQSQIWELNEALNKIPKA